MLLHCTPTLIPTASCVYMRALRGMYGEAFFFFERLMGQPSVDCLLMRARMRYVCGLGVVHRVHLPFFVERDPEAN